MALLACAACMGSVYVSASWALLTINHIGGFGFSLETFSAWHV
jgi:hypothetical protein